MLGRRDELIVPLSAAGSDASAATGVAEFNFPFACELYGFQFGCDSDNPPTGSAAQMDALLNGTTMFSQNPTIDAGESSSDTAATPLVLATTSISAGDNIEFDLDQIGVVNAGQGYYCTLKFIRAN